MSNHTLASTINATDQEAIWNFYVTEGLAAGWIGRVAVKYLIPEQQFDAAKYAEAYPDVAAAMGTDPSTLYQHYITCGIAEGRTGYATNEETTAKLKVYALSKTLTQGCKSDREKVKAIHDWQAQCCMANQYVRAMLQHSNTLWMYWGLSVR